MDHNSDGRFVPGGTTYESTTSVQPIQPQGVRQRQPSLCSGIFCQEGCGVGMRLLISGGQHRQRSSRRSAHHSAEEATVSKPATPPQVVPPPSNIRLFKRPEVLLHAIVMALFRVPLRMTHYIFVCAVDKVDEQHLRFHNMCMNLSETSEVSLSCLKEFVAAVQQDTRTGLGDLGQKTIALHSCIWRSVLMNVRMIIDNFRSLVDRCKKIVDEMKQNAHLQHSKNKKRIIDAAVACNDKVCRTMVKALVLVERQLTKLRDGIPDAIGHVVGVVVLDIVVRHLLFRESLWLLTPVTVVSMGLVLGNATSKQNHETTMFWLVILCYKMVRWHQWWYAPGKDSFYYHGNCPGLPMVSVLSEVRAAYVAHQPDDSESSPSHTNSNNKSPTHSSDSSPMRQTRTSDQRPEKARRGIHSPVDSRVFFYCILSEAIPRVLVTKLLTMTTEHRELVVASISPEIAEILLAILTTENTKMFFRLLCELLRANAISQETGETHDTELKENPVAFCHYIVTEVPSGLVAGARWMDEKLGMNDKLVLLFRLLRWLFISSSDTTSKAEDTKSFPSETEREVMIVLLVLAIVGQHDESPARITQSLISSATDELCSSVSSVYNLHGVIVTGLLYRLSGRLEPLSKKFFRFILMPVVQNTLIPVINFSDSLCTKSIGSVEGFRVRVRKMSLYKRLTQELKRIRDRIANCASRGRTVADSPARRPSQVQPLFTDKLQKKCTNPTEKKNSAKLNHQQKTPTRQTSEANKQSGDSQSQLPPRPTQQEDDESIYKDCEG